MPSLTLELDTQHGIYRERGSFPPKTEDVLVAATYGKYSLSLA